ncbi:hypothetical protein B0H19DRAFT_1134213 [Mycena capillaripes]|nr:hypothetical protein B0H19DRAFT_1134213 [Mycena capillaripes]
MSPVWILKQRCARVQPNPQNFIRLTKLDAQSIDHQHCRAVLTSSHTLAHLLSLNRHPHPGIRPPTMAPLTASQKARAKVYALYVIFFLLCLAVLLAPLLIERYYPRAAPIAAAARWLTDKTWRGFTTFSFFAALYTLYSLMKDAREYLAGLWAARRRAPRGPIALEEGTPALAQSPPPVPATSRESMFMDRIGPKVSTFFSSAFFFYRADVIALDRPLRENLVALALFLLQGIPILFGAFLVLFLYFLVQAWVKKRFVKERSGSGSGSGGAAAAATAQTVDAPAEVLIELDEGPAVDATNGRH